MHCSNYDEVGDDTAVGIVDDCQLVNVSICDFKKVRKETKYMEL